MTDLSRRDALRSGVIGLGTAAVVGTACGSSVSLGPDSFHFDHVVGTSLDGWVRGDATAVGAAVVAEIDRLSRVFSPYDPDSELSRLNDAGIVPRSPEFFQVRDLFERWTALTDGALSPRLGTLQRTWDRAARDNRCPDEAEIREAMLASSSHGTLNFNSLAKGFILRRAAEVARALAPSGGMIDLGGDLCTWGPTPLAVGIANPFAPFENGRPLTAVRVRNGAIATSGGYLRGYRIAGRQFSHLLDPRTGRPADAIAQATVLAPDATTANALATALCVLDPADGLHLVESLDDVECLIVPAGGPALRSSGFASRELPLETETAAAVTIDDPWPSDFQVTIKLEIPKAEGGGRYRRPYVAVWVENADEKIVRTVTVWGKQPRWLAELTGWWKLAKGDAEFVKAVTKATRAPGQYVLVWDGKDDKGKPLPRGTYTLKVEVHREHGKHLYQTGKLVCEAEATTVTLKKNVESEAVVVAYGKKADDKKPPQPPKP